MGLDAQVSYNFHSARKLHPEKFIDKGTYDKLGLKQGGFAASPSQPSSRNIGHIAKVKVMKRPGGRWEELMIPYSTRSVVCLHLPSFSGGVDPWGVPGTRKKQDRALTAPYIDDGLIEVVGFSKTWHGINLLGHNGYCSRLAQVHRILFEFHKGAADHTFMAIDGKPWRQPLPSDDETNIVEISQCRQVCVLVNDPCRSKSNGWPFDPSNEEDDRDSLDDEDEWEEKKKFGASDTFKLPDEVDIVNQYCC